MFTHEFSDRWLIRRIARGDDPRTILESYGDPGVVQEAGLDRMVELMALHQQKRDALCDMRLGDYIMANLASEQVFTHLHHPSLNVFALMLREVFARIGCSSAQIERALSHHRAAPFPPWEMPIHPRIAEHLGMKWVFRELKYRLPSFGDRVTWEQYCQRYVTLDWNESLQRCLARAGQDLPRAEQETLAAELETASARYDSTDGYCALSDLRRRLGDLTGSLAAIRHARSREPLWWHYATRHAQLLIRTGHLEEALVIAEDAASRHPEERDARITLFEVYHRLGRNQEALQEMRAALALIPTDPYVAQRFAQLESADNARPIELPRDRFTPPQWSEKRIQEMRDWTTGPDRLMALVATINVAVIDGDLVRAAQVIDELLEAYRPQRHEPAYIVQIASASVIAGRFDVAEQVITECLADEWRAEVRMTPPVRDRAGIVKWKIEPDKVMVFEINEAIFQTDQTEFYLHRWMQLLPIYAAYSRCNEPQIGAVDISLGDDAGPLGLAMCERRPEYFLIPDNSFTFWRGYRETRQTYVGRAVPWEQRQPIAFWRGSTTGYIRDAIRGWRFLQRIRLCEVARDHPDLLDAGITAITVGDSAAAAEIRASGLLRDYVPAKQFDQYKYQIDIDGNTNSWPGLFTKFLTGSPVLKIASRHRSTAAVRVDMTTRNLSSCCRQTHPWG
jgi:tetratricopeptide (TPR) repeat protein